LSGLTFRNSFAYAGSILFTEAVQYEPLICSPVACDADIVDGTNYASNYGQVIATPPVQFLIDMPERVRSGAPLPISITLNDGFDQQVTDWQDTVATIESGAASVSGSLRTFYQHGEALFTGLSLRGAEGQAYELKFTLSGPELFGNGVSTKTLTQAVAVQECEQGETFDPARQECACAERYGLHLLDNTCELCADDGARALGVRATAPAPASQPPR
jgi:hypothetical protein